MKGDERVRKRCSRNQKEMLEMLDPGTPFIHCAKMITFAEEVKST